jgi:serine/threonine protein kinase/tetratricopeptide (TPR) repeat protein
MLRRGLGCETETSETLEEVLDEIDVRDADWRIGNYQILEEIGRGGMGVIYRARQRHSRRIVALKRILSYQAESQETLVRFRREAEAAASLDHPNILPIYEVSESDDGLPFFSMKFAAGGSLLDVARALRKDPRRIIALMAKVTRAVQYAHLQGILHRDLKPGNILLDGRGEPMVSDFGLAKWLDTSSDLTRTLTIFGTPGYIAPEQGQGPAKNLTPAADTYSIGAVLFDLFTGRTPFLGEHALAVIKQASEKPAPKLRTLAPLADRDVETICVKCLEREPQARYRSAGDLAEDLERWLEGRPIIARPVASPVRVWRWSRRNRRLALTASACVSLGIAVVLLFRSQWQARETIADMRGRFFSPTKSIAVLPFQNLNPDKKDTLFAENVQDEILNDLTRVADLKVISRNSVITFPPGVRRDLKNIAKRLGVAHILEGDVQKMGERVRVRVQLFDAATEREMWSERYERPPVDIFSLEKEIALQVVAQVRARFSPEEKAAIESRSVRDLIAYELYREAKNIDDAIALDSKGQEHLLEAERLLKRALSRDPDLFPAQCLLARVEDEIYFAGIDRTQSRLAQAQSAIDAARQLQPDAGETHLVLAQHLYWGYRDYDTARTELATAARRLPNSSSILELVAYIDRREGRWDSALKSFQRALELDPLNVALHQQIAMTNVYMRRFPEAAAALDHALTIAPDNITTGVYRAAIDLWRNADMAPLRNTLDAVLARDTTGADQVIEYLFQLALMERNAQKAQQALTRVGPNGLGDENFPMPYALCEAMIARLRRDSTAEVDALSRAQTELNRMLDRHPTYAEALSVLGLVKAALGDKQQAIAAGEQAAELLPINKDARCGEIILENVALTYALVGKKDKAFAQLDRIMHVPGNMNYGDFLLNPRWDPLRDDPRFEKLLAAFAPARD